MRLTMVVGLAAMFLAAVPVVANAGFLDTFDTGYTDNTRIGTYAGWYDGGGGPNVMQGAGVAGSWGLGNAGAIFNWTAHPFQWNDPTLQKVVLKMDFQTGSSGSKFDDDRLAWTIDGSSTSSSNQFGAQLDDANGGMVTYWNNSGGGRVYLVMNALAGVNADTWYRFQLDITKLTATSARLDGTLLQLDSSGNPTGTPWTGAIADTSALGGDAPKTGYFTAATQTPSYKNYSSASGNADNAYFDPVIPEPVTMSVLAIGMAGLVLRRRRG